MLKQKLLFICLFTFSGHLFANIQNVPVHMQYPGFELWMDCESRTLIKFRYGATVDEGNESRSSNFNLDPNLDENCQQLTTKSYGQGFERGHMVPANHMDFSEEAIIASNTMTNIMPQTAQLNRGAWLLTEEIIECQRDVEDLLVLGGPIWNRKFPAYNKFMESHAIHTPSAYWKVVIRGRKGIEQIMAWILPNTIDAKKANLDSYIVTPRQIENITDEILPVAEEIKDFKPQHSWPLIEGCEYW